MSQTLKRYIEQLYSGEICNILYSPDGQIKTNVEFCSPVHIYSGSFNPLHRGHKKIYEVMPKKNSYFEYSLNRKDKDPHSIIHTEDIVRQFSWYAPLLITNAATFLDKIYYLNAEHPTFHIGYDTFKRVYSDYGHGGCHIIPANFVVYDRIIDGVRYSLDIHTDAPINFTKGKHIPEEISSTFIRNSYGHKPE